ncbi:MAG: response regulator [Deltaproteobacteria bacterium]|nr:response regulator [Deltaproteobacteria bacterium]
MVFFTLLNNITLVIALSVLYSLIIRRWAPQSPSRQGVSGLLFGGVAVIAMMNAVEMAPGVIFDGRSIIIAISGFIGGPVSALITVMMSATYRIWRGGSGMPTGVAVIISSALIGLAYHYLRRRRPDSVRPLHLLAFGFLVHLPMLLLLVNLLGSSSPEIIRQLVAPILIVYPLGTLLVCIVLLDRESRFHAEQALQESHALHAGLIASQNAGIYRVREPKIIPRHSTAETAFTYDFVSDRYCEIMGTGREELFADPGITLRQVHADDYPDFIRLNEEANRTMTPFVWEGRMLINGQTKWLHFESSPRELDSHQLMRTGVVIDISERIHARQAMEQAEMEWVAAMDASDDAIYILDLDRHLVRANSTFFRLTGSNPQSTMGRHIADILHPRAEIGLCPVCQAQEDKRDAVITLEKDHPDNPAGRPIEITVKMVRDKGGHPVSILVIIHDLTNTRKDQKEKERLERQMLQAQKMEAIGTLAGGIAHDFNNILTAILGYADLAKDGIKAGHPVTGDIDEVIKGALRARDLVRHILAFSRKEGTQIMPLEPHLIVNESLKLLRASLPATIDIKQDIDKSCGSILADPVKLHQVMMNLCTNAVQAMENEQGVLSVSLIKKELGADNLQGELNVAPGSFVELAVSDNGHGMDQSTMARIFEPYFSTREFGKGTGFGLSVVHGIVRECGGIIKVDSEVGKGSTFRLYFPLIRGPVSQPAGGAREEPPTGHERILAVDDERTIVEFEKFVLEGLGYEVIAKTSGAEALETFRTGPENFDLLLSDQTMPDMPGTELAEKILQIRPDIPVILCTGYSAVLDAETALAMGIKYLAMKPFKRSELAELVRKVLDERTSRA